MIYVDKLSCPIITTHHADHFLGEAASPTNIYMKKDEAIPASLDTFI